MDAAEALSLASETYPDSIEVWGVRYLVSNSVGDYAVMGECRRRVNDLDAESDTERLFHAMANVYADSGLALKELDPLWEKNPESPMLNVIRSVARRDIAQRNHSLPVLKTLIDDFRVASQRVPDNTYIQYEFLLALVDGFNFARFLGQDDLADRYREEAAELAASLESDSTRELLSRLPRATYYAAVDNWERLQEIEWTTTAGTSASSQIVYAEIFKSSHDSSAKTQLVKEHWDFSAPAYAFVELDKADSESQRKKIANDAFLQTTSDRNYAIGSDAIALEVFLINGDFQSLRARAKELKRKSPDFEWHMYQRVLNLYTELGDDVDVNAEKLAVLLEETRPFADETSYAEYVAGLVYLAHGQRDKAMIHFRNCRQQGKYDWWFHLWSNAFYSRLAHTIEMDQPWPEWIPDASKEQ